MKKLATFSMMLLTLGIRAARAESPEDLRIADQVLDDFVRAIGGEAAARGAMLYTKSRRVRKFHHLHAGGAGIEEAWLGQGRSRLVVATPIDRWEEGCEERGCWWVGETGVALFEGTREAERRLRLDYLSALRLRSTYPVRRLANTPGDAPKDVPLACVRLGHPQVPDRIVCFDAGTHLLVYSETADRSGKRQRELFSDYRWVGGRRLWFRRQQIEGSEVTTTELTEVKFDPVVAPAVFRMPRLKPRL
jgi:hypothetical protein